MSRKLIPHACALLSATILLGGCTMMPKYERPGLPVADSFKAEAGAAGAAAPAAPVDPLHWVQVERSLYALARLGDPKFAEKIYEGLQYENEYVLDAAVMAAAKVATKEMIPKLTEMQKTSKLPPHLQKPIEDLKYVLINKRREFNMLEVNKMDDKLKK